MSINAIAWANDPKPAGPVENPTPIGPARQRHHQTLTTETGKQHTSRSMPS